MHKNILIFGAGINQVTLIKACNKLGYHSLVIDPDKDAPGKKFAHQFFRVDPDDYDTTKQIAEKFNVEGIATSQMENPLPLMARLAEEKNYIFISPETLEKSLNKYLMKKIFIKKNIPCARGKLFKKKFNAKAIEDFSFPLIIKPVDAHSSRGVFRVESIEEIYQHIDETISFSKKEEFLIEEFIDGPEYSIESVTFKGKTTIVQYTEKIITPSPTVVEMGHIQPANLTDSQKQQIDRVVTEAIKALGLDNTVTHIEVKLSKKGPVVIEVGPRMGGDFISSYLTKTSCGVDLDKATIQISVGIQPDLTKKINQYAIVKYFTLPPETVIEEIIDYNLFYNDEDIIFVHLFHKKGDIVKRVTHSAQRSGVIILKANDKEKLLDKAQKHVNEFISLIKTRPIC